MATSSDSTPAVTYLSTARLGEKGQITVPKEYREALALEAGSPITVLQLGGSLLLIPEQAHFRQLCERVIDTFASQGIEAQDLLATLPETRQQVFARHYAERASPNPKRKKSS